MHAPTRRRESLCPSNPRTDFCYRRGSMTSAETYACGSCQIRSDTYRATAAPSSRPPASPT